MSAVSINTTTPASPQAAHAAAMATPLVIAGYPLVETLRTCRIQTAAASAVKGAGYGRAPVGQISASDHLWTHADRDIVTPANDLLYFCAWINLADAPAVISVPAASGRYFVIELLDAYTENFINLGIRNVPPAGGRFVLRGPSTPAAPAAAATDAIEVTCPTDLVWLLGRVLVSGAADLAAARDYMQGFKLESRSALPASVRLWQDSGDAALDFFANLMHGMAEFPAPAGAGDLTALVTALGFKAGDVDALSRANPRVLEGLRAAYTGGMRIIEAHTVSQTRKPWGYSTRLGRWNGNLLLRATTAMKGLGALCAEETIYAMADFDGAGEPLDGVRRYAIRFAPDGLPPADAFWSVSLYGADRYFAEHPAHRHAVGDRTAGLTFDADGSLTIPIQHQRPGTHAANWLPAPAAPFYLILRLYHPRAEFLSGRYVIPPVTRLE